MSTTDGWAFDPRQAQGGPSGDPGRGSRWHRLVPAGVLDSLGLRLAVLLVAALAAYHYSLLTLERNLGLDTPLAYLGLVPFMAAGLVLLLPRPAHEPDIHDRQLDLIVGLPLVAVALGVQLALPGRLGPTFWVYRIDLLSLPVFVAGVVALLFGVRTLWRFRLPVAFLLLAWPVPYTWFIEHFLDVTTGSTLAGIRTGLHWWHVGTPTAGGDSSEFTLFHGAGQFTVNVASSCSGVNSLVGFALVGSAFAVLVEGRRLVKAGWLAVGLTLVWTFNVIRILVIFWAGQQWGEKIAIEGLHPVLGLIVFSVAVAVMVALMPLFRLHIAGSGSAALSASGPRSAASGPRSAADPSTPLWTRVGARLAARPRGASGMRLALGTVALVAVVLSGANGALNRFELTAGDLGAARLTSFDSSPSSVTGYQASQIASYDWVKQYFGSASTWHRFAYSPSYEIGAASVGGGQQVLADVIDSKSLSAFNAYGIEACYKFHGYSVHGEHSVDLGGVEGHVLQYTTSSGDQAWNVVYWVWLVQNAQHQKRFERVVLLQAAGASAAGTAIGSNALNPDSSPLKGVGYSAPVTGDAAAKSALATGEQTLVGFASQAVAHQTVAPTSSTTN